MSSIIIQHQTILPKHISEKLKEDAITSGRRTISKQKTIAYIVESYYRDLEKSEAKKK